MEAPKCSNPAFRRPAASRCFVAAPHLFCKFPRLTVANPRSLRYRRTVKVVLDWDGIPAQRETSVPHKRHFVLIQQDASATADAGRCAGPYSPVAATAESVACRKSSFVVNSGFRFCVMSRRIKTTHLPDLGRSAVCGVFASFFGTVESGSFFDGVPSHVSFSSFSPRPQRQ